MQAGSSGIFGKCVCCLHEGRHQQGAVYIDSFKRCLNLVIESRDNKPFPICSPCVSFLYEVHQFREMVLSSHKQLREALTAPMEKEEATQCYVMLPGEVKQEADDDLESKIPAHFLECESDIKTVNVEKENPIEKSTTSKNGNTAPSAEVKMPTIVAVSSLLYPVRVISAGGSGITSDSQNKMQQDPEVNIKTEIEEIEEPLHNSISTDGIQCTAKRKPVEVSISSILDSVRLLSAGSRKGNEKSDMRKKMQIDGEIARLQSSMKNNAQYAGTRKTPVVAVTALLDKARLPSFTVAKQNTFIVKKIRREERKIAKDPDPVLLDNKNIRSNIAQVLKYSTILPFRTCSSTFKCFYCELRFITFKKLKNHTEHNHSNFCEATVKTVLRSPDEINAYGDISGLKCKLCDGKLETIDSLTEHLSTIHGKLFHDTSVKVSTRLIGFDMSTDLPTCHICNKEFPRFHNLKIHMNDHFGYLTCECGKKFMSKMRYNRHIKTAHGDSAKSNLTCQICGTITSKATMYHHMKRVHQKHVVKCLQCPETFPYGYYTQRAEHMEKVHGIKKPVFKCVICHKEYKTIHSLKGHKRSVHAPKKFKCDKCDYKTADRHYLKKRHMNMHSGLKNYECKLCKKKLATLNSLKLHMRRHNNDKRYGCALCDAAYIQKHCLVSHLESKHPEVYA